MLSSSSNTFYQPQSLLSLQASQRQQHPELFLKKQHIITQSNLLTELIYIIQGFESQIFIKTKGNIYVLRDDFLTQFTHLSATTIKECIKQPLKMANSIQYLHYHSKRLYNTSENVILKAFSEGLMKYHSKAITQITNILTSLKVQKGQIMSSYMGRTQQQNDYYSRQEYMTLLNVTTILQKKMSLLPHLVQVLSRVLPYVNEQIALKVEKNNLVHYQSVQVLFDQLTQLVDEFPWQSEFESEKEYFQILMIFQNCLHTYTNWIKNWIQMNPYQLQLYSQQPFFIKSCQINFAVNIGKQQSTSSLNEIPYTSIPPSSSASAKYITSAKYISSVSSLPSQTDITSRSRSSELFFRLDNLLVSEYMPKIFQKQGEKILQLGKIIQFIYLFFKVDQRQYIHQFFDVQNEFKELFSLFLNKSAQKCGQPQKLFAYKRAKPLQTLSQRMARKKPSKMRKNKKINNINNPFQMVPLTKGTFIQDVQLSDSFQVKNDTDKVIGEGKDEKSQKGQDHEKAIDKLFMNDNQNNAHTVSFQQQKQDKAPHKEFKLKTNKGMNFSFQFNILLGEVIQRIYRKAMCFFTLKTQYERGKTSISSLNHFINSQSQQPPQTRHLFKKESILVQESALKSLKQQQLPTFIPNPQRIAQSIHLTLSGIKKFMLFEQGDFILQLMSLVSELFEISFQKISKSLVNTHITEAVKSCSASQLPQQYKKGLTFMFLRKSKDSATMHLKGWTVFSILFKPEFPVNCIFHDDIMHGFAQIFNFVFNIKKCQNYLKNIWGQFKDSAKIATQYSLFQVKRHLFQSKILAIRNNAHHFINTIYGYILIKIESHWEQYIIDVDSFSNSKSQPYDPISIIKLTKKLLKLMKAETTENIALSNIMVLISELIDKLRNQLNIKEESKQWNPVIFQQELDYISHELLGVMEMARSIEGIGQTISYNNYE